MTRNALRLSALTAALLLAAPGFALGNQPDHADTSHAEPSHADSAQATPAQGGDAHGGGSDAAHAEPNIFGGGLGNAIVTLVIFGIVLTVLGKTAWPQIVNVLDERERTIRESLEQARDEREAAKALLVDYQQKLDGAAHEATAIVDEGRRDAEEVRRRIQDETRAESQQMIERARREIQLATDAAIKELYDRTALLAVDVAAGIVRKELSAEDHKALVSESLERMARVTRN